MPANELALDQEMVGHLPFESDRQKAFMGHVMRNHKFFQQVRGRIHSDWFQDGYVGQLYKAYDNFWKKYLRGPQSPEELLSFEDIRLLDFAKRQKVVNTEMECRIKATLYGEDILAQELTDWMRCRVYHNSVSESAKLFNQKKINHAVAILEHAVKEFQTTRFDGTPPADFSCAKDLVKLQALDTANALTTGVPLLDRKILPDGGAGSLLPGDTTVLIAPVNIGKTTTMITIARHNAMAGKAVLFITLEGRQLDIMEKLYCSFLKIAKADFRRKALEDAPEITLIQDIMTKNLTYISMNKSLLTVEEVVGVIRTHQNRRIALTGKGYDLLVVDYPQILTTDMARAGKLEVRQIQDYVYRQFVQLALEENFHALLAAQTNREGSKVNRSIDEGRLLTFEDVSEAFAIAMSATNIITVNRSPRDMAANRITFYVCKSRSSDVGWAVVCRSDFGHALTHSVELGATAYRGSDTMPDKIESLLSTHQNKDIPFEAI